MLQNVYWWGRWRMDNASTLRLPPHCRALPLKHNGYKLPLLKTLIGQALTRVAEKD